MILDIDLASARPSLIAFDGKNACAVASVHYSRQIALPAHSRSIRKDLARIKNAFRIEGRQGFLFEGCCGDALRTDSTRILLIASTIFDLAAMQNLAEKTIPAMAQGIQVSRAFTFM